MTKPPEDAADPHPHAPAASRLIAAHMLANVLIQGSWYGVAAMMPVLARKRFDATDWQTVMVTAALPTLMLASIFWGDLLRRCSIRTYLLIHWSAAMLPLAAGALAQNFWQLLAAHVLAAAGSSGWSPVAGDLLKGFYRDNVRGRALGLVSSAMFAGWMLMSFAIGRALDRDENIFRLYLPATAISYLCGVLILRHLVNRTGIDHHRVPPPPLLRGDTGGSALAPLPLGEGEVGRSPLPLGEGEVGRSPLPLGEGSGVRAMGRSELRDPDHTAHRSSAAASPRADEPFPPLPLGEGSGVRAVGQSASGSFEAEPQAYGAVPPGPTGTPLPLPAVEEPPLGLRRLLEPIIHARAILKADRSFARYEAAFMTYGIGWMICAALLPVLATDRLHMKYTEFASSTQVIYTLCMLLMTYPMGHLMDRIGAVRTSGLSFLWLTLYPIALIFSYSVPAVAVSTFLYGVAMAGVNIGWMLGPVALAPSREKVSQYVAIHATLVGLRGTIGQFLGMLVYSLTRSFTWSFLIAAVTFLWAAWQMWQLHGRLHLSPPLPRGDKGGSVVEAEHA